MLLLNQCELWSSTLPTISVYILRKLGREFQRATRYIETVKSLFGTVRLGSAWFGLVRLALVWSGLTRNGLL